MSTGDTMIVYIPTPITSAEQAEQLPIGTVSIADHPDDKPAIKITEQSWVCVWDVDDDHDATYDVASHGHMIGSTALVPVEAEETRDEGTGWIVPTAFGPKLAGAYLGSPDGTPPKRYTQTTWRTPWEEA